MARKTHDMCILEVGAIHESPLHWVVSSAKRRGRLKSRPYKNARRGGLGAAVHGTRTVRAAGILERPVLVCYSRRLYIAPEVVAAVYDRRSRLSIASALIERRYSPKSTLITQARLAWAFLNLDEPTVRRLTDRGYQLCAAAREG